MQTIFKFVKGALAGQNQFASGGLLLMIVGAIGVYVRSLPLRLWSWVIHQTTMMLTVTDDDTAFEWIKEWFLEQKFMKRVRWLDLDTSLRGDDAALIPAPGNHRFWYGSGSRVKMKRKAGLRAVWNHLRFARSDAIRNFLSGL
jgi:mitochondrial chaperone BCS1